MIDEIEINNMINKIDYLYRDEMLLNSSISESFKNINNSYISSNSNDLYLIQEQIEKSIEQLGLSRMNDKKIVVDTLNNYIMLSKKITNNFEG